MIAPSAPPARRPEKEGLRQPAKPRRGGPSQAIGLGGGRVPGGALSPLPLPPPAPEISIPTLRAANDDPNSWIKPGDHPLIFTTVGQAKDVTLVSLNSIFDKRYSVYWQVS